MCTHQKEITNRQTGKKLYVKCGKCPSCFQEKAAYRVSRIKANDNEFQDTLLVTLTYRRHDCPYILRDDAYRFAAGKLVDDDGNYLPLKIYRDTSYRRVRIDKEYNIASVRKEETEVIDTIDFIDKCNFKGLKDLSHCCGKIGICYYPDVQHFMARLRNILKRNFSYYGLFKVYVCSEYGTISHRPHFHLLFWVPKGSIKMFRDAISQAWQFSNIQRFPKRVEYAYRASSYVSSYVNCGSDFPKFLKDYFKPKHSYSKGFGCNSPVFQLPEILRRFDKGSLHYSLLKNKQGFPCVVNVPYPAYVVHRYFPKFKGYARLVSAQILDFAERLHRLYNCGEFSAPTEKFRTERMIMDKLYFPVYYSDVDLYKIAVRLKNAHQRFCECAYKISFSDYMQIHCRIWSLYSSEILKLHLLNPDIQDWEKYDNLEDLKCKFDNVSGYNLPPGVNSLWLKVTDPNKFVSTVSNTSRYTISYHDHMKHRSVNNAVNSQISEEF